MQKQKIINIGLLFLCISLLSGFIGKNQSFDDAMKKHRGTSITYVPSLKEGLPFFTEKTLTPTWDKRRGVVIPSFSLVNQDGESVSEQIFANKKSIVSFIFTSCSGFCPLLINKLKMIDQKIGIKENVQFVVITVDPEVDTVSRLKAYATAHGIDTKRWALLTGSKKEIYNLSRNTFASEIRQIDSRDMRQFAHTEHFYVIDKHLRMREILNGTRKDMLQQSVATIQQLKKIQ